MSTPRVYVISNYFSFFVFAKNRINFGLCVWLKTIPKTTITKLGHAKRKKNVIQLKGNANYMLLSPFVRSLFPFGELLAAL